jgi:pimeloyl-ACP methyl ester carboxylesterase
MKRLSIALCIGLFVVVLAGCGSPESTVAPTNVPHTPTVPAPEASASLPKMTLTPTEAIPSTPEGMPTAQPEAAYTPKLEARPCNSYNPSVQDREGETYACGVMIVPQDREQPAGQTMDPTTQVEVKYAILKSLAENPRPDPILFLSGGPGNSALYPDGFVELAARFGPMRETRDIILFDQRGVGMSVPALECSALPIIEDEGRKAELLAEYTARTGVDPNEDNQGTVDCVIGLWDQGVELSNFTSAASAADTVDLMRALAAAHGYEGYNLYGISYGTRLAETIMRDYPTFDLVRTITFDSVFPRPVGEFDAAYYIGKHEMFEYVFQACAADAGCNEAYPDLAVRFTALVEKLNASPLKLPDDTELSGDELYRSMYTFQDRGPGWIPLIPYLPKMIAELEQGQTETFMGMRNGTLVPSESPEIPDSVYEVMEKVSNCTAIQEDAAKNDRYRQMFNASRERVVELVNELCTPDEARPILDQVQSMSTGDVNEVVKRLFYTSARSSSPWVRTQFNCNEAYPFGETPETVEAKMREAGMPQFLIDEALETVNKAAKTCREWPSGVAPAFENEAVSGGKSGLLLNGEFDYVTYPKWAEALHGRMPNSSYVPVPNAMHSLLGNYGDCVAGISQQFLDNPAQPPDDACTAEMGVQWVLP